MFWIIKKSKRQKGFTFIELMLVVSMIAMLSAMTIPISFGSLKKQSVEEEASQLLSVLRQTQAKSMKGRGDSPWGVYFTPESYTVFKGNSYEERESLYDEVFEISPGMSVAGAPEIVFDYEGVPRIKGLVGHWTMNEGEGGVVHDLSGNDNHGVLYGDVNWLEGDIGLDFNGSNNYIEVQEFSNPNLVSNPSFEEGVSSPSNWSCGGSWSWSGDSHSGSKSIALTGSSSDSNNCSSSYFPVDPNSYYKISYWVKKSPGAVSSSGVLTDFLAYPGHARGSESGIGSMSRISTSWRKKEYVVKTFSATEARISFTRYLVEGTLYFDDFKVQKINSNFPIFRSTSDNVYLDWSERILGNTYRNYINSVRFVRSQQALRTLSRFTGFLHASRINLSNGYVAEFKYQLGDHSQLSGNLYFYIGYNPYGDCVIEASSDGLSWDTLGAYNGIGGYYVAIPASYYPTDNIYLRARSTGSVQIYTWDYQATLDKDFGNIYGNTRLSDLNVANGLTISGWVNINNCDSSSYIFDKSSQGFVGDYRVHCSGSNLYFDAMNNDFGWVTTSSEFPMNQWLFLTGTWDGDNLKLFLDGVHVDSAPMTSINNSSVNFKIGSSEGISLFNGEVKNIRIYNRAISEEEMNILYNLGQEGILDNIVELSGSGESVKINIGRQGRIEIVR